MEQSRRIRVLVAKVGLDGHDKGAILVSSRLRDAGMEVIYTGLRKTVDQVINSAIQEDVDVIGVSLLSGAHLSIAEKLLRKMEEKGIKDKLLIMGGVIPDKDIPELIKMGVSGVFTQSSSFNEMIDFIRERVNKAESK
ncbi:MAG: cobalamin B12-binding domain-containing protein [Deltaproteobacteria bacterium]|nr:cobalamin B12-binding domain-containing protein [Deltaproteobacteria bacterium]